MEGVKDIQCRFCNHVENIYINIEEKYPDGSYSRKDTFFCKSCDQLSTINTVKEKFVCKNCHSSNITKFFSDSQVKCPKCGKKGFGFALIM
jgi:hypothetical protein